MAITAICPHCKCSYELKDELAGSKIRCQKCHEIFTADRENPPNEPSSSSDLPAIDNPSEIDDQIEFQAKRPRAGAVKKKPPRQKK